jgi:hypothetical protein
MSAEYFVLWMLPWLAVGGIAVWIGYLAYAASIARTEAAVLAQRQAATDPLLELERVNTELARAATTARQTLEATRETVRRGTR